MEKHHLRELHLLPSPETPTAGHHQPPHHRHADANSPSLDLQLSISLSPQTKPLKPPTAPDYMLARRLEMLRWQAAEQKREAAKEKAYAERVREVTRREIEMAKAEMDKARIMWDKTTQELARADLIKVNSVIRLANYPNQVGIASSSSSSNSFSCIEITCHCCKRRFRP